MTAGIITRRISTDYVNLNCPKPNKDLNVSYMGIVT